MTTISGMERQQQIARTIWIGCLVLQIMATWPLDTRHELFALFSYVFGCLALARHEFLRVWILLEKRTKGADE